MQNLVTAKEMKAADENTSKRFGIDSLVLMERAALSARAAITNAFPEAERFLILCGVGNNGGDGLALSRMLFLGKKQVVVFMVGDMTRCSSACGRQLQTAKAYGVPVCESGKLPEKEWLSEQIEWADMVVDALLGVGVNRVIEEPFRTVIRAINQRSARTKCVSLDLPTGIHTDTGKILGDAVHADLTITFAFQKLGLVRFPGCEFAGEVKLADAGITKESLDGSKHFTYNRQDIWEKAPRRALSGNKGTFGKVLIIAGSHDMAGAALLCARGAYGVGAGMVKLVTCESNRVIVQTSLPEAMLLTYEPRDVEVTDWKTAEPFEQKLRESFQWADSIIVGPGLSTSGTAVQLVKCTLQYLAQTTEKALIMDADALNLIAEDAKLQQLLGECRIPAILTPHLGELSRLTRNLVESLKEDPEHATIDFRMRFDNVVLVCKDARTYVFPEYKSKDQRIFVNTLGNDGMATAGSGDVLAGIIGGLCAVLQGSALQQTCVMQCHNTACLGVAIHGAAGDLAAQKFGKASMTAGNIADALSEVMSGGQSD